MLVSVAIRVKTVALWQVGFAVVWCFQHRWKVTSQWPWWLVAAKSKPGVIDWISTAIHSVKHDKNIPLIEGSNKHNHYITEVYTFVGTSMGWVCHTSSNLPRGEKDIFSIYNCPLTTCYCFIVFVQTWNVDSSWYKSYFSVYHNELWW